MKTRIYFVIIFLVSFSSHSFAYHHNYGPELELVDKVGNGVTKGSCLKDLIVKSLKDTQYSDLQVSEPISGWWSYYFEARDSHGNLFTGKMMGQYGSVSREVGNDREGYTKTYDANLCEYNRAHTSGPSKKGCEYSLEIFNKKDQLILAGVRDCFL
jgi:hypothetical protein